ncbi:MAG: family 16 glycosylhydrolase [Nocardioides sp.]
MPRKLTLFCLLLPIGLLAPLAASAPVTAAPDRNDYVYPTNAAKVHGWGREAWEDEFESGPLRRSWLVNKPRYVNQQFGQLTLDAGPDSGTVTATAGDHAARYGRWESRVRAKQYDSRAAARFYWELVPVGKFRCGAKSIVLASYRQDDPRVHGGVRTLQGTPNGKGRNGGPVAREYHFSKRLNLSSGYFHTYAVEVTTDHITWFVDRDVIRTERRKGALDGTKYRVRFRIDAPAKKKTMARSRLQMDWVRYYDLERRGTHSTKAPRMKRQPYRSAC